MNYFKDNNNKVFAYDEEQISQGYGKDLEEILTPIYNGKLLIGHKNIRQVKTKEDGSYYTYYNEDGTPNLELEQELIDAKAQEEAEAQRKQAMLDGADYNGYIVSLTKDDGDGLVQVKSGFELGLTSTIIHFENGTKMPITAVEFQDFAIWFVTKRNSFFVGE